MTTAKLTDLIMSDQTQLQLYRPLPVKYLHTEGQFRVKEYQWNGELLRKEILDTDVIVTIDAFAYRQRHQETGRIVHIRCGGYNDSRGQFRSLKLVGVLRGNKLFVVVCKASTRMRDINFLAPLRVSGVFQALKECYRLKKAS